MSAKKIPLGLAAPAGHVEPGETEEEAIVREVKEEAGLDIEEFELVRKEYIEWNHCSRHQGHEWYVYEVKKYSGEVISLALDELSGYEWVKPKKIEEDKLEPVWLHHFKKLKYI